MAYKDSDELQANENYALGEYSFRIERSSVPGSSNDQITAICTQGGKNARKSIQVPSSTQIEGWYVEANETEASVYAKILVQSGTLVPVDIPQASLITLEWGELHPTVTVSPFSTATAWYSDAYPHHNIEYVKASSEPTGSGSGYIGGPITNLNPNFTEYSSEYSSQAIAWTMIYGVQEDEEKEQLIARFAIDLEDAGGDGPGSDWTDPGDYDPDWEPEDPTHTLYVEVTGALSGRHNDPIEDPSYSYIPADKDTIKDYGCGGDGGHGGGGGAGASTVVIHKFATNQANSKEVTAIARRHGYGSGGGKGGKGGDGCILVYY